VGCRGKPEAVRVSSANIAMFSRVQGRRPWVLATGGSPGRVQRGIAGRRQAKSDRVWDVALGAISFFLWDGCET